LQLIVGLPSHGDQQVNRTFLQQRWTNLVPANWGPLHVAALGANRRIKSQPHLLATAFGSNQQRAALFYSLTQKQLSGSERHG
jgi:hypothetical protein